MEFMGNDGHAPVLPILCGFASVSHTVACARCERTNLNACRKTKFFDSLGRHILCRPFFDSVFRRGKNPPGSTGEENTFFAEKPVQTGRIMVYYIQLTF